MNRLTGFGNFVVGSLLLIIGLGALAATDNLRWPPFGLQLPDLAFVNGTLTPTPTPTILTESELGRTPPPGTPVTLLMPSASASPTPAPTTLTPTPPPATATAGPPATATATVVPTPIPNAGLIYVGAIDVAGGSAAAVVGTDPAARRVYVLSGAGPNRGTVSVYEEDHLQKQAEASVDLPSTAADAVPGLPALLDAVGHRLYLVARSGRVAVLDSRSLAPVRTYELGQLTGQAFFSPDGARLYGLLPDQPGGNGPLLRALDLRTGASRAVRVPARWTADSAFVEGTTLYLTGRDGLLPFDLQRQTFAAPIVLGFQPLFPLLDPAAHRLYAWRQPGTAPLPPELVVLDTASWQQVGRLVRAGCPCALALGGAHGRLYLAEAGPPGRVLAYPATSLAAPPDELAFAAGSALSILPSAGANRLYIASRGTHPLLTLQDDGPAPAGRGPVIRTITP